MLAFTVWWTTPPWMLLTVVGVQVRRLSSAPHSDREMISGCATSARAVAGGPSPTEASAALAPPSTNVTTSRLRRAEALRLRTRIWTSSLPMTPTGSVAT